MILIYKPRHDVPLILRDVFWGVIRGGSLLCGIPSMRCSFPGYRIGRDAFREQGLRIVMRKKA
jgi:hypothetical protein